MLRSRKGQTDSLIMLALQEKKQKKKRRWWIRPWISRKSTLSAYNALMRKLTHPQKFHMLLCMTIRNREEIFRGGVKDYSQRKKIEYFFPKTVLAGKPKKGVIAIFATSH